MSLRVQIDKKLEHRFRELAMRRYGYSKGSLSRAAEEALTNWVSTQENEEPEFQGDPVEAIDGLLLGIDIDSVDLQHETKKHLDASGAQKCT
jgi:hypothetical protein